MQPPSTRDYSYSDNHVGAVVIVKLTQKFEKNPMVPAQEQIFKMVVNIPEKKIKVIYHMEKGQMYP
jgi:uracil DNA glycosylase